VPALPLACTVRDCGLLLERDGRSLVCRRGHSYDVARSGYVNLLQPQDRRSLAAGDTPAAVEARARLLASGVGRGVLDAFVHRAAAIELPKTACVIDLGSGSGDALASLATMRPIDGVGIDLSAPATEHAARRFPALTWVVANADRSLPLLDASVDLVLSLHGRRNPAECARVLTSAGFLLAGVPAHDDLIELRASVLGHALEHDRAAALIAELASFFSLVDRAGARERHLLERDALKDLLRATYRGVRTSAAARIDALERLQVTLASDFFLFRRIAAPARE
jgi:23S rRNA (guanine745-N1)-methyltransferase